MALVLLVPLLAAIGLWILLTDGRPVLFSQVRVGRNAWPFKIWKYRTMRAKAGQRITAAGDGRVTRTGKWLRRLKLDELPQLVNVLRGEMSLIGPRPEVPEYVDPGDARWRAALAVRPGITDLASLMYRDEEDVLARAADPESFYRREVLPAKLEMNLRYLAARSWKLDLKLLLLTARYSFIPRGFDPRRIEDLLSRSAQL